MRALLLQLSLHQAVALSHHLTHEAGVGPRGVEIPAAPQHQCLVQGVLEPVVGVLGHAVFVAGSGIGARGAQPVVVQERGIGLVQSPAAAAPYLVGEGRRVVRAHHLGRAAQGPEGPLQSLLQRQEGLSGSRLRVAPT